MNTITTIWNTLGEIAQKACEAAKTLDPYISKAIQDGEDTTDSMDVLATRVMAETMISLRLNPYAISAADGYDEDWHDTIVRPVCAKAIELAREEAKHSILWQPEFFGIHGEDLLASYAHRHPETGFGIPTESQWQAFMSEIEAEDKAMADANL